MRVALFFVSFWMCMLIASAQTTLWPRYNEVFTVCTHNSYWVKRSHQLDFFATGTQERLLDQLLFDQARAIEIDIHKAPREKGLWRVYHTSKSKNVLFDRFEDCLKQLQQFHAVYPGHEVVTVVLELKGILSGNWDEEHQPEDLDSMLEAYLGPELFRPSDLMAQCPGAKDLMECVGMSRSIWPSLEDLRGKFIFLVLGNFHQGPIGHGGLGWATYGASENPKAFPMQSDFSRFNEKGMRSEKVAVDIVERAYRQSVFMQVENLTDTAHLGDVNTFLANGGIVRGGTAFSIEEQQARIAQGYNFLQTDYPWWRFERKGFDQPFQPIDSAKFPDPKMFVEPGNLLRVSGKGQGYEIETQAAFNDWESLPSTTRISPDPKYPNPRIAGGKGCLGAVADSLNYVCLCREVDARQNAMIWVEFRQGGLPDRKFLLTEDNHTGFVGDQIRMTVEIHPSDSSTTVTLYSASEAVRVGENLSPKWNLITTATHSQELRWQGVFVPQGDVLFVGTKLNGKEVSWDGFEKRHLPDFQSSFH